jgi:ketosteroid isomerase-like protein
MGGECSASFAPASGAVRIPRQEDFMASENPNLDLARRYLAAIENGVPFETLAEFFSPEVVQEEFPNQLVPNGAKRDLAALREAGERGRKVVSAQRYDVRNAVASGDSVALEVIWTATLKIPFGKIPAGGEMTAHFGVFLDFRDGKIVGQRNYDCFDPW